MLIDDLREIQARHGYLPDAELKSLSERKGIPLYEIHGVAGFYPHFRQEPPPAASLRVCTDLSCHLHGACDVLETLRESVRYAGLDQWEVSGVSCLGQCDGAPAVSINGRSYRSMTGERLGRYVSRLAADGKIARQPARRTVNPGCIDPYEHPLAAESLKQWVSCGDAEGLVQTIKDSGLRGMGGAGFPTGVKWDLVRKTASGVKYAICNADESEPGTFKDREILYHYPHLVVEGLILGGLAVGADQGYLFLRHEYDREREVLERTIKAFYSAGYLGDGVLDSAHSFHLEIFDSPGGYICGEETALLEAMEGKRAEPRNKPPFPGTHGLSRTTHADQQRRDLRVGAGHPAARRRLVPVPGGKRRGRTQVRRAERPRQPARRIRDTTRDQGLRSHPGLRGRHCRGTRTDGLLSGGHVIGFPAGVHGGSPPGFQTARRCWFHAGLRGGHRAGRRNGHGGYGPERSDILPQRVLR